ncbi:MULTISPECIES: hypothetical protein [unclassified Exiguobacterium]|uniref:hypothetical protein n=1 Tax=unclassified Exiguobacterium TaxID=2644629 RepID=UPI0025BA9C19|nr:MULTISPECIES: hypothetical protein [unclassified Exiguobacterium]
MENKEFEYDERDLNYYDFHIIFMDATEHIIRGVLAESEDDASDDVCKLGFGGQEIDTIQCIDEHPFMWERD